MRAASKQAAGKLVKRGEKQAREKRVFDQPSTLWGGRRVVALKVCGSGMAEEGLHDGDHLMIEPGVAVSDGQTVVAEVDGELTVKRMRRDPTGRMTLTPANPEMLPLALNAQRVRIVGTLIGVFRRQGFSKSPRPAVLAPPVVSDEQTLDLSLHAIDASAQQAERLSATHAGAVRARLRDLAEGLRTLRRCYIDTRTPRLRAALLREAGALVRRVRRFDAERPRKASFESA